MAIETDLSTDIGKVRLEMNDTDEARGKGVKPTGENFTDAEIQYFLDEEGTVGRATAHACEVLARAWARMPDSQRGNRRDDWREVAENYRTLAETLRRQYGGGGTALGAMSAGVIRVDGYSAYAESTGEM